MSQYVARVDWLRYFVWYTNIDFMHYTVLNCSAS